MTVPRLFRLLVCAVILLAPFRVDALEVRQVLWGFDGRAMPGRFNPVSLLIANPGGAPFDGALVFSATDGLGGRRGVEYAQAAYIAPQTSRWVQFHVFIGTNPEEFVLRWGRGAKEREVFDQRISTGPPACVWLMDESNTFARPGAFKSFPDQLFPTTVSATDGLDAVILDYAPRWEAARRDAFLDWLKRGGIVHLLAGPNGEFPVFADALAVLNGSGDLTRVGAGQVVRHRIPRAELNEAALAKRGFPSRELKQPQSPAIYNFDDTLFQRLSSLTRPNVSWWLLNLLTFFYIIVIGPAAYRWSRRMDYRLAIACFLGAVALFGMAFAIVGRRGYGESQTVHSLSIARSLGGTRWDVAQWISAFATSSGDYTLTHNAPANLYTVPSASDAMSGRIVNGKDGQIHLEIPLYSSRAFAHRAAMTGDDASVTVEEWEGGSPGLRALRLKPGAGFPKDVIEMRAVFGALTYTLKFTNGAWALGAESGQPVTEVLTRDKLQALGNAYRYTADERPPVERLRELFPLLEANAIGSPEITPQFPLRPLSADQLRLYIVAPAPAGFHMQGKGFERENGIVLYVQDVFKP